MPSMPRPRRSFSERRAAMRERQLAARGIDDERVLDAMGAVPREEFLPPEQRGEAYADRAVGLSAGQTISQPWIVAAISQALAIRPGDRVLEIGTGSGYSAAVLAALGARVVSVERIAALAEAARATLARLGVEEVEVLEGDGSTGLPDRAPFEAIAVHAVMPGEPQMLLAQLGPGGRLVAPVQMPGPRAGAAPEEYLVRWVRGGDAGIGDPAGEGYVRQTLTACRFVPLIGEAGFPDPEGGARPA